MYKESGGGLLKPESVAAPANGATVLIDCGLNSAAALISIIFLMVLTFGRD